MISLLPCAEGTHIEQQNLPSHLNIKNNIRLELTEHLFRQLIGRIKEGRIDYVVFLKDKPK